MLELEGVISTFVVLGVIQNEEDLNREKKVVGEWRKYFRQLLKGEVREDGKRGGSNWCVKESKKGENIRFGWPCS